MVLSVLNSSHRPLLESRTDCYGSNRFFVVRSSLNLSVLPALVRTPFCPHNNYVSLHSRHRLFSLLFSVFLLHVLLPSLLPLSLLLFSLSRSVSTTVASLLSFSLPPFRPAYWLGWMCQPMSASVKHERPTTRLLLTSGSWFPRWWTRRRECSSLNRPQAKSFL